MRRSLFAALLPAALLFAPDSLSAAETRAFTADDLIQMERVADPQMSADGRIIVFQLRQTDLEADKGVNSIWRIDMDSSERSPQRMTAEGQNSYHARLSADGRSIFFLSTRSGSSQVWRMDVGAGEARQVTRLDLDVNGFLLSPNADRIVLALDVFPDCENISCTRKRLDEVSARKEKGVAYDKLFVRHWDTWKDGRRSALFSMRFGSDGRVEGEPVKVSGSLDGDTPSKPFGSMDEVAFSPDGEQIAFGLRVAGTTEPWSTNFDIYLSPVDGSAEPRNLTADNPAWDAYPRFTPDGRHLIYLAMRRAGFEADRFHIMERNLASGATREIAEAWDRSPGPLSISADGRTLYGAADDIGQHPLFAIDRASGRTTRLSGDGQVDGFAVSAKRIVVARNDLASPTQLFTLDPNGRNLRQITRFNEERLKQIRMGAFEQFSFKGWNDELVYGYAMQPANYQPGNTYPIAFIVHGGPQGSMGNSFHYRWNPQSYAGWGYGVVFIDFHGSTGYGQAFTDSITGDWGGKPLVDLEKGLAAALERYDWLDGNKVCALGASYGGYMMYWMAGQWPDRLNCIVSHNGVFEARSMYYGTEELWFDEWEHHGPYYEQAEIYEKSNPALYVDRWKTPTLISLGTRDFRIPYAQNLGAFTALQRRGVPSRLLVFHDENHWVLKPANSLQWHREVETWLARHLRAED